MYIVYIYVNASRLRLSDLPGVQSVRGVAGVAGVVGLRVLQHVLRV